MSITSLSTPLARRLAYGERQVAAATAQLTSGRRIVRAADDAAGLTTAERLLARHTGLGAAERNALDGVGMLQTADGALSAIHEQLQRVRELAVQWSNGTLSTRDRSAIQAEATALGAEATRIASSTNFNRTSLLQGGTIGFQVGSGDGETISTALPDLAPLLAADPFTFRWTTGPTVGPVARVDTAIDTVTQHRGRLGAIENRLDHRINALVAERAQLLAAESRIRDADMAGAVTELVRAQILSRAQVALMQQAQQLDRQRVLALLS